MAPTPYWTGTLTVIDLANINAFTFTQLTDRLTRVNENIALPLTREYTGEDRHVALLSTAAVSTIQSEGFLFSFQSRTGIDNGSGTNYNLYVTDAGLSEGTHSVTFRG